MAEFMVMLEAVYMPCPGVRSEALSVLKPALNRVKARVAAGVCISGLSQDDREWLIS